jgi:hypothetical protein
MSWHDDLDALPPDAPDELKPAIELVLGLVFGVPIGIVLGGVLCWLFH